MAKTPVLILPGLDGTDRMLGEFCKLCEKTATTKVLPLPDDALLDYHGLANHFGPIVQEYSGCHIIAESFSGPIGILLAQKFPDVVSRLTLVASFATPPVPGIASCLPWPLLFRLPLPGLVAQHSFVGRATSLIPLLRSAIKQNSAEVMHHRFQLLQKADVLAELAELECPLAYVQATRDRLVPKRCLDEIRIAKPDTVVHEIEGPHLILQTQASLAWRKIAEVGEE